MKINLDSDTNEKEFDNINQKFQKLDIPESKSEIKDADNEENITKPGSHKWPYHVFYNCFQIWQPCWISVQRE